MRHVLIVRDSGVSKVRSYRNADARVMGCVGLWWVILLPGFELQDIVVLHNFVASGDIISIKNTWHLECVAMLENMAVQFGEHNVGLYVIVDTLR